MMPPRINTERVASSFSRKPPVLGWNDKDALQDMAEGYAITLDNIIPYSDYVETRKGCIVHSSGVGSGAVQTLMVYNGATQSKMLAATSTAIYETTAGGAAGAALATGYTSGKWQYVNFNGYLVAVNGFNTPILYNGSAITNSTMTGTATTNLINVNIYSERLFFVEKDSLNIWYLPVKSITGTLTKFDLSFVARRGGYLLATVVWTRDAGDGVNDYVAFVTSEGEIIAYQGTDPSDANNWALIGIFHLPDPIGYRCFQNYGADAVIITKGGFLPLAGALPTSGNVSAIAISDNIRNNVARSVELYGSLDNWEIAYIPNKRLMVFNIPTQSAGVTYQYVMNTDTGAWCRLTGWNVKTMCVFNGDLYFGSDNGFVYKALSGYSDNGVAIQSDAVTAYDYINRNKLDIKTFTNVRPTLHGNGQIDYSIGLNFDFKKPPQLANPSNGISGSLPWGSLWGSPYGAGDTVNSDWVGVEGQGYAVSTMLRLKSNIVSARWLSTDYIYQRGGLA